MFQDKEAPTEKPLDLTPTQIGEIAARNLAFYLRLSSSPLDVNQTLPTDKLIRDIIIGSEELQQGALNVIDEIAKINPELASLMHNRLTLSRKNQRRTSPSELN